MEGGLLLYVIVGERTTVLELFTSKYEALLIGRDALLVLDFGLDVVDGVGRLNLERNRLAREGLDENLHTTTETEDEMESRLLLNVIIGKGTAVLELFASKDETLLVGRDALLVLDLRLHVIDRVGRLDLKGDRLACESLDENLHAST